MGKDELTEIEGIPNSRGNFHRANDPTLLSLGTMVDKRKVRPYRG